MCALLTGVQTCALPILTAEKILIASGAKPTIPDIHGAEHGITSNEIFELESLPRSIVIVGGGYIAIEFAGILNSLGSEVTLLNRTDTILRSYDAQLAAKPVHIYRAHGIKLHFTTPFVGAARKGGIGARRRRGRESQDV